jgi:hypothetical protein
LAAPTILHNSNAGRTSFAWPPAAVAFVFLEFLVVLQACLAYQDRFFNVSQMQERGIDRGLPFIWHFGMWGDFLVISVLAAYLIARYFARWRRQEILVSLAIGFASAGLMSWLYTLSDMPEAHIQNHGLTAAGWIHLIYMASAIAVFTQFFFFSGDVSVSLLRVVSVLLFAHVFFGTHMALGILKFYFPLDWYPVQPLKSVFGWITLWAVGFGLAWRNFGLRSDVPH